MVSSTTVSLNIFAFNVLFCKGLVRWHYRHLDNMQGQRALHDCGFIICWHSYIFVIFSTINTTSAPTQQAYHLEEAKSAL